MMAKRTLWQWLFGLMAKPEQDRQPMATQNNPVRQKPMAGTVSLTEDEWNERCNQHRGASDVELRDMAMRGVADSIRKEQERYFKKFKSEQEPWEPGCEHKRPHPVKENPDGTLYYKGKVYRMIGDHGRHNSKNKRRQG